MGKMASKTFGFGFAALATSLIFFGCSSSSSNNSTSTGDGTGGSYCPKIPQADIQALLSAPITTVSETDLSSDLLECDSSGLQMQLQTDDTDKSLYTTAYGDGGGDTHALNGVGDEAYWWAPNSGTGVAQGVPSIYAHKGTATCAISTDNDPSEYTMPSTTTPAPFGIQESDAAAWAAKAGKVCTDYFAAAGI